MALLSLATPAAADDRWLDRAALAAVLATGAQDAATTIHNSRTLPTGTTRERNPIIGWDYDHPVRMELLGAAIETTLLLSARAVLRQHGHPRLAAAMLFGVAAVHQSYAIRNRQTAAQVQAWMAGLPPGVGVRTGPR